jgi:hypothetical protein
VVAIYVWLGQTSESCSKFFHLIRLGSLNGWRRRQTMACCWFFAFVYRYVYTVTAEVFYSFSRKKQIIMINDHVNVTQIKIQKMVNKVWNTTHIVITEILCGKNYCNFSLADWERYLLAPSFISGMFADQFVRWSIFTVITCLHGNVN